MSEGQGSPAGGAGSPASSGRDTGSAGQPTSGGRSNAGSGRPASGGRADSGTRGGGSTGGGSTSSGKPGDSAAPGGSSGGGDWRTAIPAEVRDHGALKNFQSAGDVYKSYVELSGRFSSRKMQDMDAPADEAGREAVFAKLGHARPGTPEDYGLKYPDAFKGPRDQEALQAFTEGAFEAGLTKGQAQQLLDASMKAAGAQFAKAEQSREGAVQRLEAHFRREWGPDYEKNRGLAEQAWRENIPDERMRAAFEELGVHLNPDMVNIFAKIGRISQEGYMWSGSGNSGNGVPGSVEAAQADLAQFVQDHKTQLYSGNGMAADVIDARKGYAERNQRLAQLRTHAELKAGT